MISQLAFRMLAAREPQLLQTLQDVAHRLMPVSKPHGTLRKTLQILSEEKRQYLGTRATVLPSFSPRTWSLQHQGHGSFPEEHSVTLRKQLYLRPVWQKVQVVPLHWTFDRGSTKRGTLALDLARIGNHLFQSHHRLSRLFLWASWN